MSEDVTTDFFESTSVDPLAVETTTVLNLSLVTDDPGKGSLILNDTLTDLNVTTVEYIPIVAAATAFASLIAIGVFVIIIFTIVLIRGKKRFQEFPFFAIVYHLTFANAVHILLQLTTVLPIMLIESDEDSAKRLWYQIGSYGIMLTEQASLYFTFLMTVNRFAVFICPSMLVAFTTKWIHIISSFIWVYINFIVFWNYNYGTTKTFSRKTLSVQVLIGTNILTSFFTLCSTFLPIVMLGMYLLIFAFILKKRKVSETQVSQKKADRDTSLVVQALIITIALEIVNITDVLTPLFKKADTSVQWVWTIFCYCVTIFNQLVNPLFFLLVNKMVRGIARHIFDKNLSKFLSDTSSTAKVPESRRIVETSRTVCNLCCGWFFKEETRERTVVTF